MEKKKIYGIIVCFLGIITVNWSRANFNENSIFAIYYFAGIFVSFAGIALFASGLKKRVIEKIKICPICLYKNLEEEKKCKKCGRDF